MEHQVIEFFPSVCGVYQYPEDKINDIKLVCQKIRDTINIKQNNNYLLEVISLKNSKTAEAIIVELNITKL